MSKSDESTTDKGHAELAVALMALRRHLLAIKADVADHHLDDLEEAEHALRTFASSAVAASIAMDAHHLHQLIGMLPEYEGVEIVKVTAKTIAKIKAASATLTRAAIEQSVASSASVSIIAAARFALRRYIWHVKNPAAPIAGTVSLDSAMVKLRDAFISAGEPDYNEEDATVGPTATDGERG